MKTCRVNTDTAASSRFQPKYRGITLCMAPSNSNSAPTICKCVRIIDPPQHKGVHEWRNSRSPAHFEARLSGCAEPHLLRQKVHEPRTERQKLAPISQVLGQYDLATVAQTSSVLAKEL